MTVSVPAGCHTTADGSGKYYTTDGGVCDTVTKSQWNEIIPVSIFLVAVMLALGMFILYRLYRKNRSFKQTTKALDDASPEDMQSIYYPAKGMSSMNRLSSYSTMGSEKGGNGKGLGAGSRRGSMASTIHGRSGLGFGREEDKARSGSVSSVGSGSASGSGHSPYPQQQQQHQAQSQQQSQQQYQQQPQIPSINYAYDRPSSAQSSAPTYVSNPNNNYHPSNTGLPRSPAHEIHNPFGSDGDINGHVNGGGNGGNGYAVGQVVGQGQGGYPLGQAYGGHAVDEYGRERR